MSDDPRGFRTSTARRQSSAPSIVTVAVIGLIGLATTLAVINRSTEEPAPEPAPAATPSLTPTNSPSPSPSPTVLVEQSSEWVVATSPEYTPTPWPTTAPRQPRQPTPTPLRSQCVTFRWTAAQVFRPSAQVKIDINAVNGCRRRLLSTDLWFEIAGWRDGALVQSVRGHPFDDIGPNRSADIAIGLPGSIDWYDEITVEIID